MKIYNPHNNDLKKIQLIIFDFDETLYSSPTAQIYYENFIKKAILDLSNYTEEQALKIMNDFGFTKRGENRVSFGSNCEKFGIKKSAWDNYKLNHFFEVDYNNTSTVDEQILEKLKNHYKLALVSNEILENIEYKATKLNINLSIFNKIYAPTKQNVKNFYKNKQEIYSVLLQDFAISHQETFVIGDRYRVDILPLINLGGAGVQIENTDEVAEILNKTFIIK